jgi:hypothetical protein
MSNDPTNGYAEVNSLRMYYEVHETGRPLVLLRGAFGTIESSFAGLLPEPERIPKRRAPRRASGRLAERIRAPLAGDRGKSLPDEAGRFELDCRPERRRRVRNRSVHVHLPRRVHRRAQ